MHEPLITLTNKSRRIKYARGKLLHLAKAILRRLRGKAIVEIAVVNTRQIARLNRRFLRRRGSTDVLSFNLGKDPLGRLWGQIVVCDEVARRSAAERKIRSEDELALYIAHGLLHLLGYTDRDRKGRERMCRLAARALVKAGYADVTKDMIL